MEWRAQWRTRRRHKPGVERRCYYNAVSAAKHIGVSTVTVVRWLERGWLTGSRPRPDRPEWRIRYRALKRAVETHPMVQRSLARSMHKQARAIANSSDGSRSPPPPASPPTKSQTSSRSETPSQPQRPLDDDAT